MDILSYRMGQSSAGGGGGEAVLVNKNIDANGTYNASSDSADGYKKVEVAVPNSYGASDEGKVVSNGALVAQGSDTVTENDTYDTTLINSVTVSVPMPLEPAEEQDVNFFDYTGECVYSYTKDEFLALSAHPALPTHQGLTAYEWNWSLADAKAYVTKYGSLNIGAIYRTDDGSTRFHFDIYHPSLLTVKIRCKPSVSGGVSIDWGDGSEPDTVNSTSYTETSHTYAAVGKYVAKVKCTSGSVSFGGGSNQNLLGSYTTNSIAKCNILTEAYFGDSVILETHVLRDFNALHTVVFPYNMTAVGNYWSNGTQQYKILIFPSTLQSFSTTGNSWSLVKGLLLPKGVASVTIEVHDYALKVISPPENVMIRPGGFGPEDMMTEHIIIPDGVTAIPNGAYQDVKVTRTVYIGKDVTSIGTTAFMYAPAYEYHLKPTTPPALANINAFANWLQSGTSVTFYVPYSADHSVLNAYKTASNWSTFANYMQEEAQ